MCTEQAIWQIGGLRNELAKVLVLESEKTGHLVVLVGINAGARTVIALIQLSLKLAMLQKGSTDSHRGNHGVAILLSFLHAHSCSDVLTR